MKNKPLIFVLLLAMLAGCNSDSPTTPPGGGTPAPPASSALVDDAAGSDDTSTPSESGSAFDVFAAGLDSLNVSYKEVPMAAELVGAASGIKYKLADGDVELYEFGADADALADVTDTNTLILDGFGALPCEVNGVYAMLIDDVPGKDDIIKLFQSLN